ncbi:MAG: ribosome maturation factor RimP [Lachnospira sp.]|nr:ribosome maturation factor RimP [Lachnospira sp.]
MGRKESYEAKTEELIQPLIDAHNFELVDVEYVKEGSDWYLRVYIDKEGGITVDDCEVISRAFNEILDREDYIPDQYIFEVSSPGLLRPLKKEKDYKRSIGKLIDIKLYKAQDKQKEFTGVLKAYDDETVTLVMDNEEEKTFERANLAMIRWAFCD